jgi:hypothetical protein
MSSLRKVLLLTLCLVFCFKFPGIVQAETISSAIQRRAYQSRSDDMGNSVDWVQLAELFSSSAGFGYSASVDANVAVIGAPYDNAMTGAVYVYAKPAKGAAGISPVARLLASDGVPQDRFGVSVSVSGDAIIVGAQGAGGQGKVYVFVEPPGGWTSMTETARLMASDDAPGSGFGLAVSVDGSTAVVGAMNHSIGLNQGEGSVYVFVKPEGGWGGMTQTAELTASDGTADSALGLSVAVSGNTVVAGAPFSNSSKGAAYIYVEADAGWANMSETAELTAPSTNQNPAKFGYSVAIDGDKVVGGAPGASINHLAGIGAAFVFIKPNGGWHTSSNYYAQLVSSDGGEGDELGFSVSIKQSTVVVGAPFQYCAGINCRQGSGPGAAYVFAKPGAGAKAVITPSFKLTASDGKQNGRFGWSVATTGKFTVAGDYTMRHAYVFVKH